jgi:hypothetical protein
MTNDVYSKCFTRKLVNVEGLVSTNGPSYPLLSSPSPFQPLPAYMATCRGMTGAAGGRGGGILERAWSANFKIVWYVLRSCDL